ncbi:MAG: hypothetical protein Q4E64_03885 [Phascolarctobacterium sp.]|uniref:hypothetical protein n=1 Tax=Phascolarctobacterium sp. TaxID=2049039 RepID=UPI0026DC9462|nr:hypothetical protein [Phascolarctobacterium sp.]MDO4920954.1 hypothetical protein [Phascolarctobacterium sp.]
MNFFEKLVEAGKEKGFESATKLFTAAGVSTNAQVSCKRTGNLSDANKQRLARVLGCSIGDINRMKADALHEQNAEAKKEEIGAAVTVDEASAEELEVVDLNAIPVPDNICYDPQAEPRDVELDAKVDDIVKKNLDYHDRLKLEAEKELQAEYVQMLRTKMQEKVRCDLDAACSRWLADHNIDTAVDMLEIGTELLSLEKETK